MTARAFAAATILAVVGAAATAPAAGESRQTATYVLTEHGTGLGTSERFSFDYVNPADHLGAKYVGHRQVRYPAADSV